MNTRACCIAIMMTVGVASPCGSGESNAAETAEFAARTMPAELAVLNAPEPWTDPEWQLSVQVLEPPLQDAQRRSRNPAGRLVLPAPQTSHAPAF